LLGGPNPIKEGKPEIKEIKEGKSEVKEGKLEFKEGKREIKETKEKEFKEIKPEIEGKNIAIEKGPKEGIEGRSPAAGVDPAHALNLLAQRLDDLEQRLAAGQAFIQQSERPDVQASVLDESSGESFY
jgi:hypothetical protein